MGIFTADPDKNDGDIITGSIWNSLKNRITAFINGQLGNVNISSNPSERIAGSKVDLANGGGVAADNHHTRHEPGGADAVVDIKFTNGGLETAKLHAARHAAGGVDAIPNGSISLAMLQFNSLPAAYALARKDAVNTIAKLLGITYNPRPSVHLDLSVVTAYPIGRSVFRGGKLYQAVLGFTPSAVVKVDFSTDPPTETAVTLASSDNPSDLLLVGNDIYVLCGGARLQGGGTVNGSMLLKKIDSNDVVTTVGDLNDAASPAPTNLTWAFGLISNSDNTALYCAGGTAASPARYLLRIPLPFAAASIIKNDVTAAAGGSLSAPVYAKKGTTERVFVVGYDGGNSRLYRRLASDCSAVDNISINGDTGISADQCVYDGDYIMVVGRNASGPFFYDVWATTMFKTIGSLGAPPGYPGAPDTLDLAGSGMRGFFDGVYLHWPSYRGADNQSLLSRLDVPSYQGVTILTRTLAGTRVTGMGTDGTYLYVASCVPALPPGGSAARVSRILLR